MRLSAGTFAFRSAISRCNAPVQHAGYNEWADTNHLISLYPQKQSRAIL
jgi:hypothetical protein